MVVLIAWRLTSFASTLLRDRGLWGPFFLGGSRMLELREMFFQFEAAQSPLSACLRLKSYPVSSILNRRGFPS
jgi:hypothetical protein